MRAAQFGTRIMRALVRPLTALALTTAALLLLTLPPRGSSAAEQAPKPLSKVLYVLPNFLRFQTVNDAALAAEVAELKRRLPDGPNVRVGFSLYVALSMTNWNVDPANREAVRAALAGTIANIDKAISRARANDIPIALSIYTAPRHNYDAVQRDAERDDRRNTMWYMDNGLANGWTTHTRYARRLRRVFEAYIREIGSVLADRMRRYPETLVLATGDAEIELSFDRSSEGSTAYTQASSQLADYSPFAVAEFRDWLRNGGLYAPGQPFAGQGFEHAARYAGDGSPGADSNGDGRTVNGDFGTSFSSWELRYFDWSLTDSPDGDRNAIPAAIYNSAGWNQSPNAGAGRFDAPRVRQPGHPWWEVWNRFRETMVWRYNVEFARFITTSPDATGATVPTTRWYSHQIPADYLFGGSPNQPNFRWVTSASPHWTADISPYGGMGFTAFNVHLGGSSFAYTGRNVAPHVAARNVRWGIAEWHPSIPVSEGMAVYDQEMAMVEQYRPAFLMPIYWGDPYYQIQNTGFEYALRRLVDRMRGTSERVFMPFVAPSFLPPSVTPERGVRDPRLLHKVDRP
jgi:hypothetical protein